MRSRHPLAGAFCHTKMLLLAALASNTPAAHAQSGSVEIPGSTLGFGGGVVDQQTTRQPFVDQASGISVKENAYEIRIELEADVLFDFDKAVIRPSAARALHQAANLIRIHGTSPVHIEGHTDSKGSADYNQRLSEHRANSVRLWLAQEEHLTTVKFMAIGYGASRPVAPNFNPDGSDDPAGRQLNRRVELVLLKR
jgi:outer membrane protein OmpA-like peptidoglycan-associated protein